MLEKWRGMVYNLTHDAGVVELADARDSKSRVREDVRVRPPPPAPRRKDPLPLRFPLSRQTAQDGVLSPFSAATRCAGLAAEEKTGSNMDCFGVLRTVREDGSFFIGQRGTLQMRGQICSLTIRQNVEVLIAYLNKLHNERPQPRRRRRRAHMVKIPQYQRLPDNAPKVT